MKMAAAYIRVSTHMQEELSPDAQRRLLIDYAKKNDMILTNEYIFVDSGISGRKAEKRPAFLKMIELAKAKKFEAILVWKFSRFARNQEESIVYKSMLRNKCNVDVISITENVGNDIYGGLIERIIEWMDEFYSIRLAEDVTRGMTEKALRGGYQASPPLGYRIEHKGEIPVVVPEEAAIVRIIFEKYTDTLMSDFEIARYLNERGFCTRKNKPFESRGIKYILQNPTYTGMVRWNYSDSKEKTIKQESEWIIREGQQEAIISKETFEKAQTRRNKELRVKNQKPAGIKKHWLSGLVKCSACGRSLSSSHQQGRVYFQCYGYLKGKCKVSHGLSEIKLKSALLASLRESIESDHISYTVKTEQPVTNEKDLLEKQLKQIDMKEDRIKEAYRNGIDSLEEYKENKEILRKERQEIQQLIDNLAPAPATDPAPVILQRISDIIPLLEDESVSYEIKSAAIRSIVEKIVYNKAEGVIEVYYYYS